MAVLDKDQAAIDMLEELPLQACEQLAKSNDVLIESVTHLPTIDRLLGSDTPSTSGSVEAEEEVEGTREATQPNSLFDRSRRIR